MAQILKITISRGLLHHLSAFRMWQALPKSILRRVLGLQEHISLEMVGKPDRVQFQMWVPYRAVARVLTDQIRAHFPDVEIESGSEDVPNSMRFATGELVLEMNRER